MIALRPIATRRCCALAAALSLICLAAACGRFGKKQEQPADFIKVAGHGEPYDMDKLLATWPWTSLPKTSVGIAAAKLDLAVPDPSQRAVLARAAARRSALRGLWTNVERGLRMGKSPAQGEAPISEPVATQVESALEAGGKLAYAEGDGVTTATASLETAPLLTLLHNQKSPLVASGVIPPEQMHADALRSAVDEAKTKLRAELDKTPVDKGTLGDFVKTNPAAARDLEALIFLSQPDNVQYRPDYSCDVELFFDRNRVKRIIEQSRGHWWSKLFQ